MQAERSPPSDNRHVADSLLEHAQLLEAQAGNPLTRSSPDDYGVR